MISTIKNASTLDCVNATTGLLIISNISTRVIAKRFPSVGFGIGLATYLAAGVTTVIALVKTAKEFKTM